MEGVWARHSHSLIVRFMQDGELKLFLCAAKQYFNLSSQMCARASVQFDPSHSSSKHLLFFSSFPERHKSRKQDEEQPSSEEVAVMRSQAQGQSQKPCNCKASSSSLIGGSGAGWEGTALLHHGSYIKLGCLQFVFSITEFATKQPKGDTAALVQDTDLEEKLSLKPHQVPVLRSNSVP